MWQWAWRVSVVVLLVVVAAILASRDRPAGMPAEVVGGALLLTLTVIGVDWLIRRGEAKRQAAELSARWEGLGGVPFRSLAAAVGDIVDALAWLLCGHHPLGRPPSVDDARARQLEAVLQRRVGRARTAVPTEGQCRLFEQRLGVLLSDPAWCRHAVLCIDRVKWQFRERIGPWAAPMLERREMTDVLTRFSSLDAAIGTLQEPLRRLAGFPEEEPAAGDPALAADRWFEVLAEAISVREDLMRAAVPAAAHTQDATAALLSRWGEHAPRRPAARAAALPSHAQDDGEGALEELVRHGPLVDGHEHLITDAELRREAPDVLANLFGGYLAADLVSAGASPRSVRRLLDADDPDLEGRLAGVVDAWSTCRHTGFGRAALWTGRQVYGLEDVTPETVSRLDHDRSRVSVPDHRIRVLRGDARLEHVQIDDYHWRCTPDPHHPEFFLHDISWLLFAGGDAEVRLEVGGSGRGFDAVSEASGIAIDDLTGLGDAMEWVAATFGGLAVALKSQHAYARGLAYRPRDDAEAASALGRVLGASASEADRTCLGDWALGRGARLAAENDLPFKLHTGYLAGNRRMAPDEHHPALVSPLLQQFPDTRFVLMHVGYPFADEALALAKHYPNAYVDWSWAWSLDPLHAGHALRRAIHAVPLGKLLLFGGDARLPDTAWAYAEQAREGLLRVLRADIGDGLLTTRDALEVAERLMRRTHLELFDVRRAQDAASAAVAP